MTSAAQVVPRDEAADVVNQAEAVVAAIKRLNQNDRLAIAKDLSEEIRQTPAYLRLLEAVEILEVECVRALDGSEVADRFAQSLTFRRTLVRLQSEPEFLILAEAASLAASLRDTRRRGGRSRETLRDAIAWQILQVKGSKKPTCAKVAAFLLEVLPGSFKGSSEKPSLEAAKDAIKTAMTNMRKRAGTPDFAPYDEAWKAFRNQTELYQGAVKAAKKHRIESFPE